MEQELDLGRYLAIARRRYLYFILPAVVVIAAAIALAYLLPRSYEATATILVESQRIPTDLASSTVTAGANERIKIIEQRLLARDNLLQIADKFGLYRSDGQRPSPTVIVDAMRKAVSIEQIDVQGRTSRGADVIGFTVSYQYTDATIASRVTNELVTSILSQNVEARLSRASETAKFFEQRLSELDGQLLQQENKIASFKRANEAALPETLSGRREELAQITAQISELDQKLELANDAGAGSISPDSAEAQQLEFSLQAKQIAIDSYKDQRDKLAPLAKKGFVPQKRMLDLDQQISLAEIDIASIKSKMAQLGILGDRGKTIEMLKSQRAELDAKAKELRENISKTPTVEAELAAMNRDYANLQAEFGQTKAKLVDAQTGERLEQDRQAERFEVLEQAVVPDKPSSPNTKRIMLAGAFGAIAAGIGLVILLEMLDTSVRTVDDLERRLQLRPIAVIPYVTTRGEKRRRNFRLAGLAVFFLAFIAAALVAIHLYYLPLDLLAERGWEKIQARLSITG